MAEELEDNNISVLTADDCAAMISGYLSEDISEQALKSWADFIELSENVDYADDASGLIADFIFLCATPEINGPISHNIDGNLLAKFKELREDLS